LYNRLRWTEREGKEGRTDSGETKGVLVAAFENLDVTGKEDLPYPYPLQSC
jgi:hypothetical protein